MRAVRVPFSPARPSRLKNEPGILPAACIRSSTSTVRGRKSASRRFPAVAVARTMVSPWRTTTAPPACLAIRPVSNEISLPAISTESRVTALLLMCAFLSALRSAALFLSHLLDPNTLILPGQCGDQFGRRDPGRDLAFHDQARRLDDAGPHARAGLLLHPRMDAVLAAVALEALEVEAERLRACPEVRVVHAAAVREQRVVELPEPALQGRRLGRTRERHRADVAGGDREVSERDAQRRRGAQALVGRG